MARHPFGGGAPDWAVSTADGVPVEPVGGAIITAWSQFLGGTQYVDLSMDAEGTQIVDHITASDGTDGLMLGQIPQFYGPDGVWEVWLSANNGPRVRAQALDTADLVSAALDTIADAATSLGHADSMFASLGQPSGIAQLDGTGKLTAAQRPPVSVSVASLTDVDLTSLSDGDVLRYNASLSKFETVDTSATWTTFTFSGSGVTGGSGAYRKIPVLNLVEFRFTCTSIVSGNNTALVCTLPASMWPSYTPLQAAVTTSAVAGNVGRVGVGTNGDVNIITNLASAGFVNARIMYLL